MKGKCVTESSVNEVVELQREVFPSVVCFVAGSAYGLPEPVC